MAWDSVHMQESFNFKVAKGDCRTIRLGKSHFRKYLLHSCGKAGWLTWLEL